MPVAEWASRRPPRSAAITPGMPRRPLSRTSIEKYCGSRWHPARPSGILRLHHSEKPMTRASLAFLAFVAAAPPEADAVKIEEVVRVPSYCEGIVFDRDGNGYVSH